VYLEGSFYARYNKSSPYFFFLLYVRYSRPPFLSVILFYFSHDRFKWSPSFSSNTF